MHRTEFLIDRSEDVHHQATLLRAWSQDYAQIRAGRFRGSVTTLRNGALKLFSERMNRATFQMGSLPAGRLAFGLPLQAAGQVSLCGEDGGAGSLLVFSGAAGFEFRSPDGFEFLGIEIDTLDGADPVFQAMAVRLARLLAAGRRAIPVDQLRAGALARLLAATLGEADLRHRLAGSEAHAASFNRGLIGFVLDMLPPVDAEAEPRPMRHWDAIVAIRRLVCTSPCCPLSVAELSVVLGLSRRTLQNACQETVGLSPVKLLRALRLNEARRMLESCASVTEAATQFGFWHLGYFARDYRALFGELPSATLARHRRRPA